MEEEEKFDDHMRQKKQDWEQEDIHIKDKLARLRKEYHTLEIKLKDETEILHRLQMEEEHKLELIRIWKEDLALRR